jgi:hypothetical protein
VDQFWFSVALFNACNRFYMGADPAHCRQVLFPFWIHAGVCFEYLLGFNPDLYIVFSNKIHDFSSTQLE